MAREETRNRILAAALDLISQRGYLKATTREIAARAKVTELTIFRHFGSKENLFKEVLEAHSFLPRLKTLLTEIADLSYEEALKVIGIRFIETMKQRKPLIQIMHTELKKYPSSIITIHHNFVNEHVKILGTYFESIARKDVLREFNHKRAAGAYFAILFSYFREEEIVRGNILKPDEISVAVNEFVDIFTHGTVNYK